MSAYIALKVFCSFIISLSGVYIGMIFSSRYDTSLMQIKDFKAALKTLYIEISMNATVLDKALECAALSTSGIVKKVFGDLSNSLLKTPGDDVYECFVSIMDGYKKELCIDDETERVIKEFGKNLGRGNIDDEAVNINKTILRLELLEDSAMEKKSKNSKLCRSLGFAAGVMVTVLLL